MELSSVELKGNKIIAHYRKEIEIHIHTPQKSPWLKEWWDQGFEKIIPSWHGYGYGYKNGEWYEIDMIEKKILWKAENPLKDKYFILGHVVSENEWGRWIEDIPIIFKKS